LADLVVGQPYPNEERSGDPGSSPREPKGFPSNDLFLPPITSTDKRDGDRNDLEGLSKVVESEMNRILTESVAKC
jgi:hypothetical protein